MDLFRRIPIPVLVASLLGVVIALVRGRRELQEAERIGAELGQYYGERDRAAAEQATRQIRLTWAVLAVSVLALIVALVRP